MLKRFFVLALAIGCCQGVLAQANAEDKGNAPSLVFEETVHDFGKVVQNAPATCRFTFQNKGKAPLIISNVTASCGCTVPSWPKEPILPGGSGMIEVRYSTAVAGGFSKMVYVYSNAAKEAVGLRLKGEVIKP